MKIISALSIVDLVDDLGLSGQSESIQSLSGGLVAVHAYA